MAHVRTTIAVAAVAVLAALGACAPSGPESPESPGKVERVKEDGGTVAVGPGSSETRTVPDARYRLAATPAAPPSLDLVRESNEVFSMDVPAGWQWESIGQFTKFGLHVWDPAHPERQVFFYVKMDPVIKSAAARDFYAQQAAWVAGESYAQMYADAPIVDPPQVATFFTLFDTYVAYARAYGIQHAFPELNGLEVLEVQPLQTPIGEYTGDDAVVRAAFTTGGVPSEGLFAASVFDPGPYVVDGIDTMPLSLYNVTGISASAGDFLHLQDDLSRSLASFAFTEEYVAAAARSNEEGTEAMLQWSQTMNAAYDSYNQAWWSRQEDYDALSQQRSDGTLGYDRLYDTQTGEIYRAELGFYDQYQTNRDEYSNPNLELIPQNDTPRWQQPIDYYID